MNCAQEISLILNRMSEGRTRWWLRKRVVVVGMLALLIGSCQARWPAKPTGLQKTLFRPDGRSITFTEWEAERVIKLPFSDGNSAYIEFDGKRVRIHGGDFGSAVGQFLVSPHRDAVIVERAFEGGATSGVLIDLKTGAHRNWDLFSNNPSVLGWSKESWGTSREAVPREQLYWQLRSTDFDVVKQAMNELEARQFIDADWLAMAEIVGDPNAPAQARKFLAFSMVYCRHKQVDRWRRAAHFGTTTMPATRQATEFDYTWPPKVDWPQELIRLYEKAADDPDPEIRKEVRLALESMRPKNAN